MLVPKRRKCALELRDRYNLTSKVPPPIKSMIGLKSAQSNTFREQDSVRNGKISVEHR